MGKKNKIENKLSVFTNAILSIYGENPFKPMNYKQICKILAIRDAAGKDVVYHILIDLHEQGILIEERPFRYVLNPAYLEEYGPKKQYVEGTVDMKSTGKAYVILDDEEGEDVFISAANTGHALHGDRVKVAMFPQRKGHKPEGEIVEVLKRKITDVVGILHISHGYVFVTPDQESIPVDIFVPKGEVHGAKNGQKVVVHLVDWPEKSGNPFGEIIRVLGNPGDNDVEMESILLAHDYPLEFPEDVEKEAAKIPSRIQKSEIRRHLVAETVQRSLGGRRAYRRRFVLRQAWFGHRRGGLQPRHLGVSGGSHHPDASREAVQQRLFAPSQRGETHLLSSV